MTLSDHLESEAFVLAQMLTSPERARENLAGLSPDLFRSPYRRQIASVCIELLKEHGDAPPGRVFEIAAKRFGHSDQETADYWAEAVYVLDTAATFKGTDSSFRLDLAHLLEKKAATSTAAELARLTKGLVNGEIGTAEALADIAELRAPGIECGTTLADAIAEIGDDPEADTLLTGVEWWDRLHGEQGPRKGLFTVVGGPPGLGKTALALQLTIGTLAKNADAVATWAAGEMSPAQLAKRALACTSGLALGLLSRPREDLSDYQRDRLDRAMDFLASAGDRLRFLGPPLTPAKIEQETNSNSSAWLVVDYLQLVRSDRSANSRREEVDEVVRELTRFAAQGIAVMAVSNMAKGHDDRGRGRDVLGAFKESSEIAYAADACFVLEQEEQVDEHGDTEVLVRCLKNRHGPAQGRRVVFRGACQRFQPRGELKP